MLFKSNRKFFYCFIFIIIIVIIVLLVLRYWKVTAFININVKQLPISQAKDNDTVITNSRNHLDGSEVEQPRQDVSVAANNEQTRNIPTEQHTSSLSTSTAINITIAEVIQDQLEVYQDTIGVFYNYNQGVISAENSGIVETVNVDIGDYVSKGQILATVNQTSLLNNKKRLEVKVSNLHTQLKNQRSTLLRSKELFAKGFLSQSELDAAILAEKNIQDQLNSAEIDLKDATISLEKSNVKAPSSGIIQDKKVTAGDLVNVGSFLFSVVNNDNLHIVAAYPEIYSDLFQQNQKAIITLHNNKQIISFVKQIKPLINTGNRSIEILIDIKNNQYNIKPGGTAKVSILVENKSNALFIPQESVVLRSSGLVAYVVHDNVVTEVPIQIGVHKGNNVEVVSGLQVNDVVAVSGAKYLENGSLVYIQK